MKLIHRIIFGFTLLFLPFVVSTPYASAADIRTGGRIVVSTDSADIKNIYLFGDTIAVTAPIGNDLIAGGGKIDIDSPIAQSAMIAGGTITVQNKIGNSLRVAGGNITIDSEIVNDLLIAGGNVTVTKDAKIGGDVLFAGGTLQLDAPVQGKVLLAGGQADINNTVGKGVEGQIGQLALGQKAVINGDLKYTSEKRAMIDTNAKVNGQTIYTEQKDTQKNTSDTSDVITSGALYMLLVDILLGLLFLYFFRKFAVTIFKQMKTHPVKNAVSGFAFLVLFPLAGIFMLMLLPLGISAFLLYGLLLIIAGILAKLFAGWFIMDWYTKREDKKKHYTFDWKAVVIGPVVIALITLFPILGGLITGVLFLISLGAVILQTTELVGDTKN